MMPHAEAILRYVSGLLAELFFTGLWQGAATAFAVSAMLRLSSRAGAEAHYVGLRVAFVLLAVLPWVHFSHAGLPRAVDGSALRVTPVVATVVAAVWAVMAMVRALQLLLAYRHLRAVWWRAVPLQMSGKNRQSLLFGKRQVVLCTSEDVDSPTVLGFCRPRLLLPEWLTPTLTDSDLQQIALHECEHLRRRDDWMNLLQQVALLVLPLHPALLWLNCRLNLQRELACDAAVIVRTAEPIAYANCLTRLSEQRVQHRDRLRLALAAWERRSELGKRVHALLNDALTCTPAQSRFAATAMTLVFAAGALVMARAPQLVQVQDKSTSIPVATTAGASIAFHRDLTRVTAIEPVAYRAAQAGLTTVAFREPLSSALSERKSAAVLRARALRRKRAAPQPELLRTAFPYRSLLPSADQPTRLVTTKFPHASHAYAAVPFGDGWLLIQL